MIASPKVSKGGDPFRGVSTYKAKWRLAPIFYGRIYFRSRNQVEKDFRACLFIVQIELRTDKEAKNRPKTKHYGKIEKFSF